MRLLSQQLSAGVSYRASPRVAHQTIAGEAVLVDLAGSRMLGLNATGSLVWSLIADHDEEAIAHVVCERYEVDAQTARTQVREFIGELVARGLVISEP